jgi:hypothetical protein
VESPVLQHGETNIIYLGNGQSVMPLLQRICIILQKENELSDKVPAEGCD